MEITEDKISDYCIVRLTGRLDAMTAPDLEKFIKERIDEGKTRLVLELSGLEYLSSAGLRVFLFTAKKLKTVKGELSLAGQKESIREVITISGFPSIMPCFDTLEELAG